MNQHDGCPECIEKSGELHASHCTSDEAYEAAYDAWTYTEEPPGVLSWAEWEKLSGHTRE